ncbi:MAG: ATPase [Thermoanaerobacteraceae bacterium]|nr:ATPase [Thermoanaerobacteraceae bacterium]
MEVLELLQKMEDLLNKSVSIPISGKILVDRDVLLKIIQDLRLCLPDDLKRAEWIQNHKQEILLEAQQQSDVIISEAEKKIKLMVDDEEIVKMAKAEAEEIIASAQKNAKEIRLGSKEYADSILEKLENDLTDIVNTLRENRNELKKI